MTPEMNIAINLALSGIFAIMKASGMAEEEAKAQLQAKVAQIESLNPLPM